MKTKTTQIAVLGALAAISFILISPKWTFAPAAWIAPAFLLVMMQRLTPLKGFGLGFLILFASGLVANYNVIPFPPIAMAIVSLITTLFVMIPYMVHRLSYPRFNSWLVTFIFPCTYVLLEYFRAGTGAGTFGLLAYSQVTNASLLQVVSITGIWGISFLLYWCGSTLAWVAEKEFQWKETGRPLGAFASVLLAVLLFGSMRTNPFFEQTRETVRVAGITASNLGIAKAIYEDAFQRKTDIDLDALVEEGKVTITSPELQEIQKGMALFVENPFDARFAKSRVLMAAFRDTLLARAGREANAGAKIISFSEALMFTVKQEEEEFVRKGQQLASQHKIFLLLPAASILPGKIEAGKKFMENKSWLIDPSGRIVNTFLKNRPVPVAEAGSVPGDGIVPVIPTPYGNVATSICFDADFPSLIRQAGEKNADIMLLPSGDWREIAPRHAEMAMVRAVENGFSLLRTASGTFSVACDYHGRVAGTNNYYDKGNQVVVANLPVKGIKTIYAVVGDAFVAWCAVVLGAILMLAWRKDLQSFIPKRLRWSVQ